MIWFFLNFKHAFVIRCTAKKDKLGFKILLHFHKYDLIILNLKGYYPQKWNRLKKSLKLPFLSLFICFWHFRSNNAWTQSFRWRKSYRILSKSSQLKFGRNREKTAVYWTPNINPLHEQKIQCKGLLMKLLIAIMQFLLA